jgi:quinoprotein glucose dehydrogenase
MENMLKSKLLLTVLVVGVIALPVNAEDWPAYGGAPGGGQYSALDQINIDNVDDLEKVWEFRSDDFSYGDETGDPTAFEANPIFVNDAVYLCTAFGRVVALAPDSGKELWIYDPKQKLAGTALGIHICRGVSYWESTESAPLDECEKRIFVGLVDSRVIAIDADDGTVCPDFGEKGQIRLADLDYVNPGVIGITSPPAIIRDLVVVGGVISSYSEVRSPNGILRAFDAVSGEERWNWNPLPEEMRESIGGVNVWPPMAVDEERNLIFVPTGSATVDPYGANRLGEIPYANAVVALDADTGKPRWHYQMIHHDLWDYDLASQPILADIRKDGRTIPVVMQFTKTGLLFVLNRETGEPVFEVEERPVPASDIPGEKASPTQPFPVRPKPLTRTSLSVDEAWGAMFWHRWSCEEKLEGLRNEGMYTPPSVEGSVQLPNGYGGVNWGNASYDPIGNKVIVLATQIANVSTLYPRDDVDAMDIRDHSNFDVGGPLEGTPYQYRSTPILSSAGSPCTEPPWGTATAIDMDTGEFAWQVPFGRVPYGWFRTLERWGSPLVGGPISTAGGLMFAGAAMDHRMRALDSTSGELLWESDDLPAPGNATPMTYMYGGKQYVVIAAGGNAVAGTELSDAVIAFALPDNW